MTDLTDLSVRVRNRRRQLDVAETEERLIASRFAELSDEVVRLSQDISTHERATSLLNSIGEEKQYAAQEAIEQLVTRGLQTIFSDGLSFHILQDVKARRAEVSFIVRSELSGGKVVDTDILESRGGGLAATVGFLLRLTVMLLRTDTKQDNVLVLDETFAHVSEEYLPALGEFLQKIVEKTGVQIIMVTHQPEFMDYADKVYRLSFADGKSIAKEQS
jgi:DNA repair exonuclease SbcCD ATPase subunit